MFTSFMFDNMHCVNFTTANDYTNELFKKAYEMQVKKDSNFLLKYLGIK